MDEYTCAMCEGVFKKTVSEEDAKAELKEFFGDVSVDDCDVVCDDCWEKIRPDKQGFDLPVSEDDVKSNIVDVPLFLKGFFDYKQEKL